jgi:predicted transcriptional regulator
MSPTIEKAIEALEAMPEEMRENAVAYLVRQAAKFQALRDAIDEGMADVEAGRVVPWDPDDILQRSKSHS